MVPNGPRSSRRMRSARLFRAASESDDNTGDRGGLRSRNREARNREVAGSNPQSANLRKPWLLACEKPEHATSLHAFEP
eukprot:11937845-Alexandrium_andersonii.AAC.1